MNKNKLKLLLIIAYDLLTMVLSSIFAILIVIGAKGLDLDLMKWIYLFALAICSIGIYAIFGIYRFNFKYSSVHEVLIIGFSNAIIFALNFILILIFDWFPKSWPICNTIFVGFFTCALRFGYRIIKSNNANVMGLNQKSGVKRAMIIGAGACGVSFAREMFENDRLNMIPVCFIDDDNTKLGQKILGVKVEGAVKDIPSVCIKKDVSVIYVAIASATSKRIAEIINVCKDTNCKVKVVPGIGQLIDGNISLKQTRDVDVNDLLGREEVKVNLDEILGYIEGKTVLVTGGGGSIGSELCRQIANHNPKLLIILDIYENNAYNIEQELKMKLPNINLIALIASVRDKGKIEDVFKTYKPNVVFHAAAHKHVPLMETSPNEAIKNNVFGTFNVAKMADKYNVEKFILISTDKAVNPTNIMGASKRLCEMIVQSFSRKSETDFVAVRFGNVLGSNGSVIPLFKKQIENGGPVTVTHKDIIRYFMTISEAVSLVLQAGAYAHGGEIFVLDMGEPCKIYDLAYNLIKLSGYTPNVDMEIKITGLRPGEKLYEEMLMAEEGLQDTANKKIHIGKPIVFDEEEFQTQLDRLYKAAYEETNEMKKIVSEIVTTYKPQ